jgi:O-antigen/teichoic acid export membrane protein
MAGRLWSETGVVFAGNVVARGLGFLFPILLARAVAKDEFGTVYFFIGTGFFVSELVLTGFPTAMTRYISSDGPGGGWLSSAVAGGVPLLLVSLLAGEALALVVDAPPGLMSMVVIGLTIDAYYFGLLRGLRRFKLLASYRVSANLTQLVLLLGAVAADVASTGVAVAIYSFVYLIPIAVIEVRRGPLRAALRGAVGPSAARIRVLGRFAVPALVSGTAYAALTQADVFFVTLLAPEALPDYAAARSLAQPVMLVPYAIAIVMLPAVAAAGEDERWRMLRRATSVTAVLGAALCGLYLTLGSQLVDFVFPAGFGPAADSVSLLVAALALMGLYSVLSQWWMGIGRPGTPAVTLTAGAVVAIGLQFALTPAHGGVGSAGAIAAGVGVALLSLAAATLRIRQQERSKAALAPS